MTMIKKIKHIENFGTFEGFDWDSSVCGKDGKPVAFKTVNILYGRNYSGKTTLSRIFQRLGDNEIPYGYGDGKFTLVDDCDNAIENKSGDLANFPGIVRVFNRDFVKENLSFLHDDEGEIKPFVVLGKDSVQTKLDIGKLENKLGTSDEVPGLRKDEKDGETKWKNAQQDSEKYRRQLNAKLQKKAATMKKPLSLWGYDINRIGEDIDFIRAYSRTLLAQQKVDEFKKVLNEQGKEIIHPPAKLNLQLAELARDAKELVEREIKVEKPISEIASTPEFRKWIQQGLKLHREENRGLCEFCQQNLPKNLLMELEGYFNDEVEKLTADIDTLLEKAEHEQNMVRRYGEKDEFDSVRYVETVKEKQQNAIKSLKAEAQTYSKGVRALMNQLVMRKNDILNRKEFEENGLDFSNLSDAIDALHNIINEANEIALSLTERQEVARKELRLNQVREFMRDIDYPSEKAEVIRRERRKSSAEAAHKAKSKEVSDQIAEIELLKAKLGNEATGAETVNNFLRFCFGHELLSLHAVKEGDGNQGKYQFVIKRNNGAARNLSDGERNLIAFCYFMASLSDSTVETPKDKLIIWIDDPVSSLDANHIFSVYSLIYSQIVEAGRFKQLFVSTHNLDFLKYLSNDNKHCNFFHIERQTQTSTISVMPEYLRKCATEFNHLFLQIRKCAKADKINGLNHNDIVTFGNNARRFLELFLYYLYPNNTEHNDRMRKFFKDKDSTPRILAEKVLNELSHFQEGLERGVRPRDVNKEEIQKVANDILNRIKKLNPTQFCELMESTDDNNVQN